MFRVISVVLWATLGCAVADPMRPDPPPSASRSAAAIEQSRLTLSSVYVLDQQAYALINGQWLSVDDRLGDYRVISIAADQVVIQNATQQRTLTPPQSGSLQISLSHED